MKGLWIAIAGIAFLAMLPAPALAAPVECGDVITHDTRLDRDLVCPGEGVTIGASGITFDLRGHEIRGGSGFVGIDNGGFAGPGFDDVTIANGFVSGFSLGVRVSHAEGNRLVGLTASGSDASGIVLFRESRHNSVERSRVLFSFNGIALDTADANTIERNDLGGNGKGIALFGSNENSLSRNVAAFGGVGAFLFQSSQNELSRNTLLSNDGTGVSLIADSDRNLVERNVVSRNGDDGILAIAGTTIEHNRADGNGALGIDADPGVIDAGQNRASNNANPFQCLNVFCK